MHGTLLCTSHDINRFFTLIARTYFNVYTFCVYFNELFVITSTYTPSISFNFDMNSICALLSKTSCCATI